MVDTIEESDVSRLDGHVDPKNLNASDIESAFRRERSEQDGSDLSEFVQGDARSEFAERIEAKREPVREEAREQLASQISEPGANGRRQLYGEDPETGRNTFVGTSSNIETEVRDDGTVLGVNQNTGTRAIVGEVNLDARR
jgi:hypothetical protein